MPKFVLASASTARLKLLKMIGIEATVHSSNYDESLVNLTNVADLVNTLAWKKAETVAHFFPSALVLGCDSVLEIEGEIYGKPDNPDIAIKRWQKMRGKIGKLYTGHALINTETQAKVIQWAMTQVYFADIDDSLIKAYVATEEPLKCAGNFALEGKGGVFIDKIIGCHSNVIGLSLPLLRKMLEDLNFQVTDFW